MPRHTFICLIGRPEGIAQGHAKGKLPSIPDFTTINRRINKLNIQINNNNNKNKVSEDEYLIIVIDSTGKVTNNRGQLVRDKWNIKKKGYLKIHV